MPTGRDASLVRATLLKAGIEAQICLDSIELARKIADGAGAVLMAEEGLKNGTLERLSAAFKGQPVWSDLPVVLFAAGDDHAERLLEAVGTRFNATIVERPIRITMLVSAVRGALRARQRQYQSRNLLNQLEESDRQKDLFLATLSHELRTPLNSILGWIQLLNVENSPKPVDTKHALAVIERNARVQAEMISDILFVSRIITGKLKLNSKPLDALLVLQAATDVLRPAFTAKDIDLKVSLDSDLPLIEGDADRLQQIFWNLLSNAIKFTPPAGRIEISARNNHSNVEIKVKDSGQGIKQEFLPYVFERFRQADSSYTRQVGGLGLGLAIVRHLVELHGGTVTVESAGENLGATFTVRLPVVNQPENDFSEIVNEETPPEESVEPTRRLHVLLVEDDEDSREMMKVMFEQSGIEITGVASAAEAVEVVERLKPDVLISDIGLPNEDGYELIGRIRRLSPEQGGLTPAIALTGYASLQDRKHAFNVGYQEHLSKPVDIDELLRLVKNLTAPAELMSEFGNKES